MTICIAAICRYGYQFDEKTNVPIDSGAVIITASDRMMTAEKYGIEYEPFQMKRARLSHSVEVLVADDIVIHSELVGRASREIGSNSKLPVKEVADTYAKHFRDIKSEQAEQLYLSPLRLDMERFIANQRSMNPEIAMELSNNILNYRLDAEALIVGVEGNSAHIYHMDSTGIISCHDDIGFAAIGIGTMHSNSLFMANSYGNIFLYYNAFPLVYAAKRRAEIAPGVGKWTDMTVITRDGVFYIEQDRIQILRQTYDAYEKDLAELQKKAINEFSRRDVEWLQQSHAPMPTQPAPPTPQKTTGVPQIPQS